MDRAILTAINLEKGKCVVMYFEASFDLAAPQLASINVIELNEAELLIFPRMSCASHSEGNRYTFTLPKISPLIGCLRIVWTDVNGA